jgi:hypothetical protein
MRRRWARLATAVGCWAMSQKRTCPVIMHSTQNRPSYAMQQSLVGRRRQLGATAATAAIQNLVTDDATMQRFKRPAACCRRCGRAASIIRNLSSTPLAHAHALIMAENLTQHRAGKALLALLQAQKGLADDVVQQITQLTAELLEEATGSGPAAGSELCGCAGGLVLAHAACVAAPPPPPGCRCGVCDRVPTCRVRAVQKRARHRHRSQQQAQWHCVTCKQRMRCCPGSASSAPSACNSSVCARTCAWQAPPLLVAAYHCAPTPGVDVCCTLACAGASLTAAYTATACRQRTSRRQWRSPGPAYSTCWCVSVRL